MTAPNMFKGYECTVATDSLGGTTLGKVQEFSLSINNNLSALYKLGSRTPDSLKEGNLVITGSVKMAIINNAFALIVAPASAALQSDDDLYVQLDEGTNSSVDLTLADLKWDTYNISMASDGSTVMENGTFIVKTLTIGTTG